jgi:hypothetical protein
MENRHGRAVAQPTTNELTRPSQKSTISPEREAAWKDILTESSFALGKDMLTGYALSAAVHAFERLNRDIPTELLPAVYERSMKLTDEKGNPVYWDARALSLAYWKLLEESDGRVTTTVNGRNLLPETASSACPRCQGTGQELMPDGTRRKGCKHEYTSDEEADHILVRDRELVAQKAKELREGLAKLASIKAMPSESIADKLTIVYTCTACRRKESSEFGWQFNDPCGARLPGPVREDERLACRGVMQVL